MVTRFFGVCVLSDELVFWLQWAGLIMCWVPSLYFAQKGTNYTELGTRVAITTGVVGCTMLTLLMLFRDMEKMPVFMSATVLTLLAVAIYRVFAGLNKKPEEYVRELEERARAAEQFEKDMSDKFK
jgi:hypothetical protein